jgi:hypothetical protein
MIETIKSPSTIIQRQSGTEGPSHDPYGYTRYTFLKNGLRTDLHLGLGISLDLPTGVRYQGGDSDIDHLTKVFEEVTGLRVKTIDKAVDRIHYAEHCSCGSRKLREREGFPGETLLICVKCGDIVGSRFNESAII